MLFVLILLEKIETQSEYGGLVIILVDVYYYIQLIQQSLYSQFSFTVWNLANGFKASMLYLLINLENGCSYVVTFSL